MPVCAGALFFECFLAQFMNGVNLIDLDLHWYQMCLKRLLRWWVPGDVLVA